VAKGLVALRGHVSFDGHLIENGVIVGNAASERHAVPGEGPEEFVVQGLHLHVIAEHALAGIAVVLGWRQEGFKIVVDEMRPSIGADGEMCRENREAGGREAVACVVEDADDVVRGDRHGWNSSLHLPGDEYFRPNRQATIAVVGQPPHGQPIVAGIRIAVAVNVEHIARFGIDRSVIGTTQQRVDRAELLRLRAVGIGDGDARRVTVEAPSLAAIGGAVQHVVDVL